MIINHITFTVQCENPGCLGTKDLHTLTDGKDWANWVADIMQCYQKSSWEGICDECKNKEHASYEEAKNEATRTA